VICMAPRASVGTARRVDGRVARSVEMSLSTQQPFFNDPLKHLEAPRDKLGAEIDVGQHLHKQRLGLASAVGRLARLRYALPALCVLAYPTR